MNRAQTRRIILLLLAFCGILAAVVVRFQSSRTSSGTMTRNESRSGTYTPFTGELTIPIDYSSSCMPQSPKGTALDGLSLEAIVELRLAKVRDDLAILNLFPPHYHPLKNQSMIMYQQITPGRKWMGSVPYYLTNPYLPVVVHCASHVTPLDLFCRIKQIRYHNGVFEEIRRGGNARQWLEAVASQRLSETPGFIELTMVNAYDAGFVYALVDLAECRNIKPPVNPQAITTTVFNEHNFFHVGRYGVNNLSPHLEKATLELADMTAATRLTVKLWRTMPANPQSSPGELTYSLIVDPTESEEPDAAPVSP